MKVEINLPIQAPAKKIISAFLDPHMLKDWWSVERTLIEQKVGGTYLLAWNVTPQGFGYVASGVIGEFDPGHSLIIENYCYLNPERAILGPMRLIVRAWHLDDQTTQLYLCQDGYQQGGDWDWYYQSVKQAWPMVGDVLKNYLEQSVISKTY
jgi:hypothetical protein